MSTMKLSEINAMYGVDIKGPRIGHEPPYTYEDEDVQVIECMDSLFVGWYTGGPCFIQLAVTPGDYQEQVSSCM